MNGIKRKFVLIMALLIVFSAFAPFSVQKAEAGSKYYLPTKVTYYKYKKGKWVKDWSESIKYNKKGYVLESRFKQGKQTEKYKYKYSYYKNGKLKKKKLPGGESYIFNKEGRMTEYRLSSGKVFEKYKYKGSRLVKFYDGDCWFKLTYTEHQDGSIARIETRIPGDPLDVEPKRWSEFDENGLLVSSLTDRSVGMTMIGRKDPDAINSYLFVLFSLEGKAISGNKDAIASIRLSMSKQMEVGIYDIILEDVYMTSNQFLTISPTECISEITIKDMILGDVNNDNDIDIADVIGVVNYILKNPSETFILGSADINMDGDIDIADVIGVVNIILRNTSSPSQLSSIRQLPSNVIFNMLDPE